jgi:hypothetical protein
MGHHEVQEFVQRLHLAGVHEPVMEIGPHRPVEEDGGREEVADVRELEPDAPRAVLVRLSSLAPRPLRRLNQSTVTGSSRRLPVVSGSAHVHREIAAKPCSTRQPTVTSQHRFHGGTKSLLTRCPKHSRSRLRPVPISALCSSSEREEPNSAFRPVASWLW